MGQAGLGLAMREYGATVVVVLMLVEGSQTYTPLAGRVRKKQALRDSSLDTEPPCFAVGGADNDDVPPATASYIAFAVAVLCLKRYCCDLFSHSPWTSHQHQLSNDVH
jgi:hypothetical protein